MVQRCSPSLVNAFACRTVTCPVFFTITGVVFFVGGIVIAAIGFGTRPKDMFDTSNMSLRIVGLVFVGAGILPAVLSGIFWWFYCLNRRGKKLPGQKKSEALGVVYTTEKAALNEYPYPPEYENNRPIYKPGPPPDDSGLFRDDDSFASAPLNFGSKSSSGPSDTSKEKPRYPSRSNEYEISENENWSQNMRNKTGLPQLDEEIPQMRKSYDETDVAPSKKQKQKKRKERRQNENREYGADEEPLPDVRQSNKSHDSNDSFREHT